MGNANFWQEIQALDVNGNNIALNKTDTVCTYSANTLTFGTNPRVFLIDGTIKTLTLATLKMSSPDYYDIYIDIDNSRAIAVGSTSSKMQYINTKSRYLYVGWVSTTIGKYSFSKLII